MVVDDAPLVRLATLEDFDTWFAIYESVAAEGKWIGGELPLDRERRRVGFEALVSDRDALALMAELDGVAVGHLGATLERGVADFGMAVDQRRRGSGIGSALLERCLQWARTAGAHKVTLQVWPHNVAARALYAKYGFRDEGVLRRHYRRRNGELWDAVFMGLVLDEHSPGSPWGP